eukprot:356186-Chlamydomonas_euryale.AAC.2
MLSSVALGLPASQISCATRHGWVDGWMGGRAAAQGGACARLLERVVAQEDLGLGHCDVGLGLALVRGAGHARADLAVGVEVDDDAVLRQLLLDQDDLLGATDDKVAARVERALAQPCQLRLRLLVQHAPADRHAKGAPESRTQRRDKGLL